MNDIYFTIDNTGLNGSRIDKKRILDLYKCNTVILEYM